MMRPPDFTNWGPLEPVYPRDSGRPCAHCPHPNGGHHLQTGRCVVRDAAGVRCGCPGYEAAPDPEEEEFRALLKRYGIRKEDDDADDETDPGAPEG